jgi:hypothetical protein
MYPRNISRLRCMLSRSKDCSIGEPIIIGRCASLSEHESQSMLRTYLVCREKQEREREKARERNKQTARGISTQCTNNSNPITSTSELFLRQNSECHCACSPILGSPTWVWPLRNRDPPAKICLPTNTLEEFGYKKPMTSSGMETATFRLVAQWLNQLICHVPRT